MKTSYLLMPFLLGCSNTYLINSHSCPMRTAQFSESKQVEVNKRIYVPITDEALHKVDLDYILKEKDLRCRDFSEVSIALTSNFWDALVGLVPMMESKQVTISGKISHDGNSGETKDGN